MRLLAVLFSLLLPSAAFAVCGGSNLIDALAKPDRSKLEAVTATHPYATGNLWRATRDGATIEVVGTYHLGDARHDPMVERVMPLILAAETLLVEASPEEESKLLQAMGRNPDLMLITEGPSLLEQLPPDEWADLSRAMAARGIPGFMAAKFKPWYVAVMLGMPPCAATDPASFQDGLDKRIMKIAEDGGIPIRSLEPYDTIFGLFAEMSTEDQLNMIRSTMLFEAQAEDMSFTLAESYFAEESRMVWEYMRGLSLEMSRDVQGMTEADAVAEFARLEETIINARNRKWIAVLQAAATEGPVFAAFGALHLSGEAGVLNLLAENGWTLERIGS